MTVFRAWTSVIGVLCLTGTALAQSNSYGTYDPYAVRLTRLDDSSQRGPAMNDGSSRPGDQPVMRGPVNSVRTPENVTTPQPMPGSSAQNSATPSSSYENALNSTGWGEDGGSSGGCGCGLPSCCASSNFFAYVGGLTMGRDVANHFYTTYQASNVANQLLYYPGADWGGGVDTRIGYWFGCGCNNGCNSCSCGPRLASKPFTGARGDWMANRAFIVPRTI